MSNRVVPTYGQPVSRKDQTTISWYRFFQDMDTGVPHGLELSIALTASPFTYSSSNGGTVLLTGGVVSAVQLTRATTVLTGQTAGFFPLSAGDQLTVTYTGLPTMTFYPN